MDGDCASIAVLPKFLVDNRRSRGLTFFKTIHEWITIAIGCNALPNRHHLQHQHYFN